MSVLSIAKKTFLVRAAYAVADLFSKHRSTKTSEPAIVEAPTTKEGTIIPVVFGTRDIKSPILAWYGNSRKESNLYYISAIFVLCYGKVKNILRIAYGDKLIWSGVNTGLPSDGVIQKNSHFSDESGLYGNFTFDNGGNYNSFDSFSSQLTGVEMKYNRLSHLILKDVCIGPVASLKSVSIRVVGLGVDKEEVEWNSEDSQISTQETIYNYSEGRTEELNDWDTNIISINMPEPYNVNIKLDYKYQDVNNPLPSYVYEVAFIFVNGLLAQQISDKITNRDFDYLTSFTNTYGYMQGTIEVPINKIETISGGMYRTRVMRLVKVDAHDPTVSTVYIVPKIPSLTDLNPANIIYYAITNKTWGMGYSQSDVDLDTFNYCADVLKSEGFGLSIKWEKSGPVSDLIQDVLEHIDAVLFVDRKTGKFKLNLIRQDYNLALLTVLDSRNIEAVNAYKRTSSDDLCNTVSLSYYDTLLGDSAGITVSDSAMIAEMGKTVTRSIDYPGISNIETAKKVALRELKVSSSIIESCTIVANYAAKDLDIGDAFILDYPKYTSVPTVFRVLKISFGDGVSNKITIEASKDVT